MQLQRRPWQSMLVVRRSLMGETCIVGRGLAPARLEVAYGYHTGCNVPLTHGSDGGQPSPYGYVCTVNRTHLEEKTLCLNNGEARQSLTIRHRRNKHFHRLLLFLQHNLLYRQNNLVLPQKYSSLL